MLSTLAVHFLKNGSFQIRDQLLLNLYLSPHLKTIYRLIRRRAIVQYFIPFAAADIRKMASVFRVTIDEVKYFHCFLIISLHLFGKL